MGGFTSIPSLEIGRTFLSKDFFTLEAFLCEALLILRAHDSSCCPTFPCSRPLSSTRKLAPRRNCCVGETNISHHGLGTFGGRRVRQSFLCNIYSEYVRELRTFLFRNLHADGIRIPVCADECPRATSSRHCKGGRRGLHASPSFLPCRQ